MHLAQPANWLFICTLHSPQIGCLNAPCTAHNLAASPQTVLGSADKIITVVLQWSWKALHDRHAYVYSDLAEHTLHACHTVSPNQTLNVLWHHCSRLEQHVSRNMGSPCDHSALGEVQLQQKHPQRSRLRLAPKLCAAFWEDQRWLEA